MRRLLIITVALAGCAKHRPTPWPQIHGVAERSTRRELPQGPVVGFADSAKTHAWLGVPYAAPPVGALRWRAPQPAQPWGSSPREATAYGAVCPQFGGRLSLGDSNEVIGSEDCLTLNVSAPQFTAHQAATAKRAVMVWVHGGGNTIGTANTYGAMRNLAAKYGVVVVAMNYRLGVLGWFHHAALNGPEATAEDASGNYGTLDLIAALTWVHENIATFGGDPDNVTLFGESAGGFNAFSMLVSPMARGLFSKVIIQSGVPATRTIAEAENFTDAPDPGDPASSSELLLKLLIADGTAKGRAEAKSVLASMNRADLNSYLRAKTPQALLAPLQGAGLGMYSAPTIFRDGLVEPMGLLTDALADPAQGSHVPVMLGTNRDEFKLFMAMSPKYVGKRLGLIPFIRDVAVYERDAALVSDLWRAVGVDAPAKALIQAQGSSVFTYRFDWAEEPSKVGVPLSQLLGAAHGLEIQFVFDDVSIENDLFGIANDENQPGRALLADTMSSYWVNFAKTGSPGTGVDGTLPTWAPASSGQFMTFDTVKGGGVRMQSGVITADALETRIWSDASFIDDATRCRCDAWVFYGSFGRPTGLWSPERAARFASHCPKDSVQTLQAEPH